MDLFSAFQSNFGTGVFTDGMTGAFSTNIASTSSVQACVQTVCSSTPGPPSPFNLTVQFSEAPSSGGFSFDYTDITFFGAGSPVGSYILFGQLAQGPQISGVVSASAFGEFSASRPAPGSRFTEPISRWARVRGAAVTSTE